MNNAILEELKEVLKEKDDKLFRTKVEVIVGLADKMNKPVMREPVAPTPQVQHPMDASVPVAEPQPMASAPSTPKNPGATMDMSMPKLTRPAGT